MSGETKKKVRLLVSRVGGRYVLGRTDCRRKVEVLVADGGR